MTTEPSLNEPTPTQAVPTVNGAQAAPPAEARASSEKGATDQAREHLFMHFTKHGAFGKERVPVAVRGEGCYIHTADGRRLFDGLSGLFCAQLGYSFGSEIAPAVGEQMGELPYYTNWSFAHPPAVKLAARLADLAPGDLNHVLFTSGGSESVESAAKLSWQYHQLRGDPHRRKLIARRDAYHGTTALAMTLTGLPGIRAEFEPLFPGVRHVSNTKQFRRSEHLTGQEWTAELIRELRATIEFEGPETIAAMYAEPIQNSGGSIPPPEGYGAALSELCAEYGILLVADEVISAFGRQGHWFASERYGFTPDLITFAKGVSAGYAPIGGVMISDKVAQPFLEGLATFNHGFTFGGHPLVTAVANRALDIFEREDILGQVNKQEPLLHAAVESLRDMTIVGDVRGAGYFWSLELVEPATGAALTPERGDRVIELMRRQLDAQNVICRVDRRAGDVVVTLSPPLIATVRELQMLIDAVGEAITHTETAL